MRLAALDIGTNTILMLVADVSADGSIHVVRDEQVIARLGKGVDQFRRITPETFTRALGFLHGYLTIAESCQVERIVAGGTSALRDAVNAQEFVGFIRERLGISIEILSGHKEAEFTYLGAVSEFASAGDEQEFAVLDIGGGSTELTTGAGTTLVSKESLDIGSVRLTERVLKSSPPSKEGVEEAILEISSWTRKFHRLPSSTRLLGVAGTVTTLAAMDLGLQAYDPQLVNGHFIQREKIQRFAESLMSLGVAEMMRAYPQIQAGRADVIYAGVLVLLECLKELGFEGIVASDRGLRFGMALNAFLDGVHKP